LVKTFFINPVESVFASLEYPKSVKVFWSPHPKPSVSKYIIQRQNKDGKFLNVGAVKNRLFVEFFDKDLEDGQKYRYQIIAENFMGDKSRPSVIVEGKTKDLPKEIANVRVSQNLTRQIELSWDKSQAEAEIAYRIYASTNRNATSKFIAHPTNTSYVHKIQTANLK
ncbi:hypothetical protein C2R92_00440, partial [Helicobacter pylori]